MILSIALSLALSSPQSIDADLARRYFQEAKWACEDDGGKLWGRSLWGPMIFADARTRQAVCSEAAPGFKESGGVWIGDLPKEVGIANTATKWAGKHWTMVMWPLPTNRGERARLMTHELFHRIQDDLGLPASSPQNAHVDTEAGRVWLQLEARALAAALTGETAKREEPIKDALLFRAYRQSLFAGAKAEEDALELNEGLAEFTGFMMKGSWEPEARLWLGRQMQTGFGGKDTYSRSFAYRTGPAYGFLINLEEALASQTSAWRTKLKRGDSLAEILGGMVGFKPVLDQAESRAAVYGFEELRKAEGERERVRREREAKYTKALVDGPVLVIPFKSGNFQFDPYNVFVFGDRGTVYPTCTLIDEWGTLSVTDGVLIAKDFATAWVPAPASGSVASGPGWTLKLASGWNIVSAGRKGDFTLVKSR